MKKFAGFMFLEFIIVLVTIGILVIIAIPIYKRRVVKNEALKVDSYEEMQSQETPLEDYLQDSEESYFGK
jgi:Tfp pilus assembly protein PilE